MEPKKTSGRKRKVISIRSRRRAARPPKPPLPLAELRAQIRDYYDRHGGKAPARLLEGAVRHADPLRPGRWVDVMVGYCSGCACEGGEAVVHNAFDEERRVYFEIGSRTDAEEQRAFAARARIWFDARTGA